MAEKGGEQGRLVLKKLRRDLISGKISGRCIMFKTNRCLTTKLPHPRTPVKRKPSDYRIWHPANKFADRVRFRPPCGGPPYSRSGGHTGDLD